MTEALRIDCACHGNRVAAVVCGHLLECDSPPLGFIENSADPDDLQAWCYACEYLFLQEEDKTPRFEAFNRRAIVCRECYADIKARHDVSA
jgi:hypothetical protein